MVQGVGVDKKRAPSPSPPPTKGEEIFEIGKEKISWE